MVTGQRQRGEQSLVNLMAQVGADVLDGCISDPVIDRFVELRFRGDGTSSVVGASSRTSNSPSTSTMGSSSRNRSPMSLPIAATILSGSHPPLQFRRMHRPSGDRRM